MTRALLDRQPDLPRSFPLFRYAPARVRFSWRDWNPALDADLSASDQRGCVMSLAAEQPTPLRNPPTGW